jgi:hypothetical protein
MNTEPFGSAFFHPDRFNLFIRKIHHRLALQAYQVVVRCHVRLQTSGAVVQTDLLNQAVLDKRVNVLVHGCERDGRDLPPNPIVDCLGARMIVHRHQRPVDHMPLMSNRQALIRAHAAKLVVWNAGHNNNYFWIIIIVLSSSGGAKSNEARGAPGPRDVLM